MKPLLYLSTYTGQNDPDAASKLLGTLADATSCIVTEQRNGEYELELEYLPTGVLANSLKSGAIIVAKSYYGGNRQPFRIYRVEKSLTETIVVNAHHISYDLNKVYLKYFADQTGITAALAAIKSNLIQQSGDTTDWNFATDITNTSSVFQHPEPSTVRAALGGTEGSILDVFGGEYEWDNLSVFLHKNRGQDRGVYVRYAGNLLEFNREEDFENAYTHVMVYWFDEETGNKTTSLSYAVSDVIAADFTQSRTAVINVTDQFETQPNRATLNPIAQDYAAKMTSKPTIGLEVKFVDLNSTTEGGAEAPVKLCDTIHVIDPVRDVSISAKVVETRWNVLLDRYEDVTIGTKGKNIADTISGLSGGGSSSSGSGGGGGSTETDYRNLSNKPQINGVELDGNKSLSTLGIASASDLAATTATANAAVKDVTVNGASVVNANKVAQVTVPTKTSDLTNDSNFATTSQIPTKTSDLTNDSNFATTSQIPDSTSDLTNDSGFITDDDLPSLQQVLTSGTEIARYFANAADTTGTPIYAPTGGGGGSYSQKLWTAKSTTVATAANVFATLDDATGFSLTEGVAVLVRFTNGNTNGNYYLNVGQTGNIPVNVYDGTSVVTNSALKKIGAGEAALFVYDGTRWVMLPTSYGITSKMPDSTSDLTNDSGFITASDVPTKTSDLTNDSGFITASDIPSQTAKIWTGKVTTAAATAAKTVTLDEPDDFPGWGGNVVVALTFTNGNSAANPTLSYAGLAIPMAGYDGSSITTPSTSAAANMIGAGETVLLYPSGQYLVHGFGAQVSGGGGGGDKTYIGTCATAQQAPYKVVDCDGFTLETGAIVFVKFTYAHTTGTLFLNVEDTGNIQVSNAGAVTGMASLWAPGEVVQFTYDGTNWLIIDHVKASTSYPGIVALSSSTSSNSETAAATSKAVKAAYDNGGVQSVTPDYSTGVKVATFATTGGTVDLYLPVYNGSVTP